MITVKFDYRNYKSAEKRVELIMWARDNNGSVFRDKPMEGHKGRILSINFDNEIDAIACRLKFGL
jgi:hypothetical protein